jgi:predicted transcriptional regulator
MHDAFAQESTVDEDQNSIIEMTTGIVSAYVGNNSVPSADLPSLIQSILSALNAIATGGETSAPPARGEPAVSIKKSISPDALICLEDGRKFKSLKRHLRTKYNLSPEDYRAKWGLPKDYPMVAPSYAAARSALAKSMGLGQGGRQPSKHTTVAAAPTADKPAPKTRAKPTTTKA